MMIDSIIEDKKLFKIQYFICIEKVLLVIYKKRYKYEVTWDRDKR